MMVRESVCETFVLISSQHLAVVTKRTGGEAYIVTDSGMCPVTLTSSHLRGLTRAQEINRRTGGEAYIVTDGRVFIELVTQRLTDARQTS